MFRGLHRTALFAAAVSFVSCGPSRHTDNPFDEDADLPAGQALIEQGDYEKAATVFEALAKESPDDPALHYYLGLAKAGLDDVAGAEAAYKRAIELDATLLEARSNLGVLLLAKGDLEAARYELEACLDLDPEDADSHYNLGLALEASELLAEAEKEFARAAELAPDDPLPLMALAEAARRAKKLDAALGWYEKAASAAPGEPLVSLGKAQILLDLKKGDDAAAALRAIEKMEAADATALASAGLLLAKAGRDADAIDLYRAAIGKDQKFPRAHVLLANALARAKRFDEAAAEFEKYLELAPDAEDADAARKGIEACTKQAEKKP
ncbi:MAG: tetratricopeptide repeat protein [Proteobacteria bacterium]|jgi:Flp pilus assembly protein TadD|nr:tetratricopeptide repeat protein [Pseudomonadota bacterium]